MCFSGIGFGFFHISIDLTEQGLGKDTYKLVKGMFLD
jgi:hypothetical protein